MTKEVQIMLIEGRIKNLEARGSHNNKIVNKWKRKLRQLQK
jgi:hypothetical protein